MGKRLTRILLSLAVSLALPITLGMPTYAEGGTAGSGSGSSSGSGSTTSGSHDTTTTETEHTTTTEAEKPEAPELTKEQKAEFTHKAEKAIKAKGIKILETAKAENKEHTKEDKLKNCADKKQGLEKKIANLKSNSTKHLAKIDAVLKSIKAADTTDTKVAGLLVDAATAQTTATASVDALNSLTTTIDCNKDSVASDVAMIKAAADQARTDLKAYKTSVKAVLNAIENTPASEGN